MSDESDIALEISDGETIPVQEDAPSDTTINTYCTVEDITGMFENITDEISDEMFTRVIANSTAWIEENLKWNYVPIPSDTPNTLTTVAVYHCASDIYLTLSQGSDDFLEQYDTWFNKAQSLLDKYIEAYLNNDAENSDLIEHQCVKSRRAKTYNEKRGRRGVRQWVR